MDAEFRKARIVQSLDQDSRTAGYQFVVTFDAPLSSKGWDWEGMHTEDGAINLTVTRDIRNRHPVIWKFVFGKGWEPYRGFSTPQVVIRIDAETMDVARAWVKEITDLFAANEIPDDDTIHISIIPEG